MPEIMFDSRLLDCYPNLSKEFYTVLSKCFQCACRGVLINPEIILPIFQMPFSQILDTCSAFRTAVRQQVPTRDAQYYSDIALYVENMFAIIAYLSAFGSESVCIYRHKDVLSLKVPSSTPVYAPARVRDYPYMMMVHRDSSTHIYVPQTPVFETTTLLRDPVSYVSFHPSCSAVISHIYAMQFGEGVYEVINDYLVDRFLRTRELVNSVYYGMPASYRVNLPADRDLAVLLYKEVSGVVG